jgi:predicted RNA binding protein YcfA (HicA-like mRNA interferase family)
MKKQKMDGAHAKYRERRTVGRIIIWKHKGDHLKNRGVDGRVILKMHPKKTGRRTGTAHIYSMPGCRINNKKVQNAIKCKEFLD